MPSLPVSVLDLAPVPSGSTPAHALRRTLDLAQHVERWGYHRFWLAEHHNMAGIASAATAVVIGYVAAGTRTIRVGAGGIMLPNHAPLVIAEQFGTLESLYPGRIDLGLGRAPGTDQRTLLALRRSPSSAESFLQDVIELRSLLGPVREGQVVRAVPGARCWLARSSGRPTGFARASISSSSGQELTRSSSPPRFTITTHGFARTKYLRT